MTAREMDAARATDETTAGQSCAAGLRLLRRRMLQPAGLGLGLGLGLGSSAGLQRRGLWARGALLLPGNVPAIGHDFGFGYNLDFEHAPG